VAARGGVRGLVLATGVGVEAAFERDEIIQQLQRDEMREGGEPLAGFGTCFRDDERMLGGNFTIRRWRGDGDAHRFQFTRGAQDLASAVVAGPSGEKSYQRRARIDL